MNVLWTYHFIHGNTEVAEVIWQDHVKKSNQIMFQKVSSSLSWFISCSDSV